MGAMNEPVAKPMATSAGVDFSKACFDAVAATDCHDVATEVQVRIGLNFIHLYAGVYEHGQPTNRIINVAGPWDVRASWRVDGPLRELICGKWCVQARFESIGEGPEFTLHGPEFVFGCEHECYSVVIPGGGIRPDDCGAPYKAVVTLTYKSMCGKPGPILGFVEIPMLQFYHSQY